MNKTEFTDCVVRFCSFREEKRTKRESEKRVWIGGKQKIERLACFRLLLSFFCFSLDSFTKRMTEEALAAPAAPAPAPAEAAEAAPAKTEAKTEEGGDAGAAAAAPKTAGADAAAPAAPTTAPIQTQEAAAAAGDADAEAEAAKKDPAPADSVISARLRELLEETDLEKTSGERERNRDRFRGEWDAGGAGDEPRRERRADCSLRRALSLFSLVPLCLL